MLFDVNRAIMSMLSINDASRTKGLGSICYRRSLENPFFQMSVKLYSFAAEAERFLGRYSQMEIYCREVTGKPLQVIEEQCRASISQMVELKKEEKASCLQKYWQLYLFFMGASSNTVELGGKAMDEKEVLLSTGPSHVTCILVKMFGRYELGAHLVIKKGDQQYLKTEEP